MILHPKLIIVSLLLVLCLLTALPATVLAIADPDTAPQVTRVTVFDDLLEDGDTGMLIDYYLDYAAIPTETATEAYMASFIDTDGTTQLGTEAPYTYVDSGYGRGAIWIYFTAAEVTADSISSANEALHSVWLMGNPTVPSGWAGDPPKTTAVIDEWWATGEGDPAVLLRSTVLTLADALELAWSLDMIEETSLGARLTTLGVSYFTNVIPNLRDMAPACFPAGELAPTQEDIDYTTSFGATMTDGAAPAGGTVTGSPVTFINGYTGTADAGSTNVKIIDAELTQEDDYWNGAALSIPATGELAIVSDFIAATDELQFAALSAVVGVGDSYTVTGSRYAGIADAGSTNIRLRDAALTQEDDYWNSATLIITTTTDGERPEGERTVVTDFVATTNDLQFSPMSATIDAGDTYTVTGINSSHIVTVTATGTFVLELDKGTIGTIINGVGGVVTGSPVAVVAGTNTITVTNIGTLTVTVALVNTQTTIRDTVIGTGFDLTEIASRVGLSRATFSGLVWLVITVLLCAATYKSSSRLGVLGSGGGEKTVLVVLDVSIIGGAVLGLVPILAAAMLFIIAGFMTGYVLFYRGANF